MIFHNPKKPFFFHEMRLVFEITGAPKPAAEVAGNSNDFEEQYQKLRGSVNEKLFNNEEVLDEKIQEAAGRLEEIDPGVLRTFIENGLRAQLNYRKYNRLFCEKIMGFDVSKIKPAEQMQYAAALQLHLMRSFGREVFEHGRGLNAVDGKIGKYTLSVLAAYWNYNNTEQNPIAFADQVKDPRYKTLLTDLPHKLATRYKPGKGLEIKAKRPESDLAAIAALLEGMENDTDARINLPDGTEAHLKKNKDGYLIEHGDASRVFTRLPEAIAYFQPFFPPEVRHVFDVMEEGVVTRRLDDLEEQEEGEVSFSTAGGWDVTVRKTRKDYVVETQDMRRQTFHTLGEVKAYVADIYRKSGKAVTTAAAGEVA